MVVLGEKICGGPANQSADVLRIVSGALFLRSSMIYLTLLMASERLPHTWTARRKRSCGICGLVQKAFMWHMWTGAESVRVMCIKFSPAGGVH
jgi:hypothetical protein